MKKVLVSLLVLALATSAVFAGVNFSGGLTAGYQFQWDTKGDFSSHVQGNDGDDTNTTKINLSIADDNGIWNVNLEGTPFIDDSGAIGGDVTVDLLKSFGVEGDFGLKIGLAANDEQVVQRAYHSVFGKNFDRIRTNAPGVWANAALSYGDLVTVTIAGAPELKPYKNQTGNSFDAGAADNATATTGKDLMVSAIVKPVDGVAVSVGYVMNGKADDNASITRGTGDAKETVKFKMGGNGLLTGAVDVNVGALAGLDFDLGVSVADKFAFGVKDSVASANLLAASVYAGFDVATVGLEFGWQSEGKVAETDVTGSAYFLGLKAGLDLVENMLLNVYAGAWDVNNFAKTYFVGGEVGYTLASVTYKLGIEYSAGRSMNYDNNGFVIVPSISVAW